jgi:hypothetical protein
MLFLDGITRDLDRRFNVLDEGAPVLRKVKAGGSKAGDASGEGIEPIADAMAA